MLKVLAGRSTKTLLERGLWPVKTRRQARMWQSRWLSIGGKKIDDFDILELSAL